MALGEGADGIGFSLNTTEFMKELNELAEHIDHKSGSKAIRAGGNEYKKLVAAQIPMFSEASGWGRKRKATKQKWKKGKGAFSLDKLVDDKDTKDVHLRKSIAVKQAKGAKRRGIIQYQVGITGWARAYAHVFEFGSKYQRGSRVFTKTLESRFEHIIQTVANVLKKEIEKKNGGS